MKEVKFITIDKGSDLKMDETVGVPDGIEPKKYIEDLIKEFNAEEDRRHEENKNYKSLYRSIVEIQGESGKQSYYLGSCEFINKLNTVTIMFKNESFDIYRCKNCRMLLQKETLVFPEISCYPELVCVKCNKRYRSKSALNRHNKIGNPTLPEWIDFSRNLCDLGVNY